MRRLPEVALATVLCAAPALPARAMEPQIWEQTYRCTSGRVVTVRYENPQDVARMARLFLGGREVLLHQIGAASGRRFATEEGLKSDRGLQWWVKGRNATLSETVLDPAAGTPRTLDTCRAVTRT